MAKTARHVSRRQHRVSTSRTMKGNHHRPCLDPIESQPLLYPLIQYFAIDSLCASAYCRPVGAKNKTHGTITSSSHPLEKSRLRARFSVILPSGQGRLPRSRAVPRGRRTLSVSALMVVNTDSHSVSTLLDGSRRVHVSTLVCHSQSVTDVAAGRRVPPASSSPERAGTACCVF